MRPTVDPTRCAEETVGFCFCVVCPDRSFVSFDPHHQVGLLLKYELKCLNGTLYSFLFDFAQKRP